MNGQKKRLLLLLGFIIPFFSSTAQDLEQRISIEFRDEVMSTVLKRIEKASNVKIQFVYADVHSYRVTSRITNKNAEEAVRQVIASFPLEYTLKGNGKYIVIMKSKPKINVEKEPKVSQSFEIRGKVTNLDGSPLPGVTVSLMRADNKLLLGTSTSADGSYFLQLPMAYEKNLRLVFRSLGMETQEISYTNQAAVNVILVDKSEAMNEVVITGYQVIDKRELTSSIETIKVDDLDRRGSLTIDQMLEGKAAGLMVMNQSATPGAASKVRVRSGGTFTGSRAPLWVVDGIIYEDPVPLSADDINSFDRVNLIGNALTGINPQDIETINILKDASATAIYGTRAANGVIVVTTKRGKKGRASINYSGGLNVVERPRYDMLNLMNSKERVDVSREIANRNLGYPQPIFTWVGYEKALRDYRNGSISHAQFQDQVSQIEVMNTDWFGELYRNSITSNHNLNLSGGSDNIRYYYSMGYNDTDGSERNVGLSRITARSNIDATLRKNLTLALSMSGSVQEANYNHSSINLFDAAYNSSRAMPFRNANGSLFFVENKLREGNGIINTVRYNVMNEMNNSERNVDNKDLNINAQLNWGILPGVKLVGLASYRNTTNLQEEWITDKTAFIANLRTYDAVDDYIADWVAQFASVPFGGIYSGGMNSQRSLRGQLQLNLNKTIAQKHTFNLNLGYEVNSHQYKGSMGWNSPGYNHEQGRSFIPLPRVQFVPGTSNLNNYGYVNMIKWLTGQDGMDVYPNIIDRLSNQVSGFAIFNYSFANRYIFNFNIRSDGSNQFGQYERYKFKPTWSVSGRWNVHRESFWKSSNPDDELALRLSYGFRGNAPSTTPYMVLSNYGFNSNFGENTANMASFPNADLTWEKTSTLNAGLNFSKFDGRLNGSFDFAYSHGTDLLLSRPVSLVNGQATQLYNGGEKKDYSYELTLSGVLIKKKDWGWRVSANATVTKESILAGYAVDNTNLNINNYLGGSIYLTGFPVDGFYSYQFDGLNAEGLPKYKNLENRSASLSQLLGDILTYSGRRSPQVYGGFNTEVRYKNLTFRSSFSYKLGHHTRLLSLYNGQQNMPMPNENMNYEFTGRWRQPGDEAWATIPGLSNNSLAITATGSGYYHVQSSSLVPAGANGYTLYDLSNARVVDASHIRWQSAGLSLRLNSKLIQKLGLSTVTIGGETSNIAVWAFDSKLKGQDPEQVRSIGMPVLPTYTFNINVGF